MQQEKADLAVRLFYLCRKVFAPALRISVESLVSGNTASGAGLREHWAPASSAAPRLVPVEPGRAMISRPVRERNADRKV